MTDVPFAVSGNEMAPSAIAPASLISLAGIGGGADAGRRPHIVWAEPSGFLPALGQFRGQDLEGRKTCRPPRTAAH